MAKKFRIRNAAADLIELLLIGTTVFLLVYILVGQFLEVSGSSMHPYLLDKEQIIAEKLSIKFDPLKRGEVIIFWHPKTKSDLLVKRVVGLPGERIKIENGFVFIDGKKLEEPYLASNVVTKGTDFLAEGQEHKIAEGYYIVLGDNRSESTDSRYWGPVQKDTVIGRALAVFYPINNIRLLNEGKSIAE
ncbi:MAG: Signal peptidase I [candidate division WWE3 bacterium GW2011_GWF2_41_45]|uniref:Signal peptidase I n=3 Tax=Katanobacteria TaxID=422282 RepID=A0A1F4VZT4_UNCKA|nr:MAG: Signal peptidase I [candidate division WWE3 bacterium GW2011_GWC2_41_23]KKS09588.1 MAG: Signal peptidase I [candidate division WWE3 bacterium GW2011_GWF2_41_45]KKS11888.1 MAG: Signal peptidase I [candidate division WWE3 bacterium GW2011_GWF1_41_53]KKS19680.1 MAG: Signal peptidase I [candidate division WWE3 bacterium GW2011_GWE1_41_72]KKS27102.1 MAG: signal peptidase I, signal peptidase I [candidate division WWE3 bacterium GW2011_GWC1_42_102]KKS30404.1 MAG: Signal peptidase I [candidate